VVASTVFLLGMGLHGASWAGTASVPAPGAGDWPLALELSVSTDKKAYIAYEPVVVTFTLRNTSKRDVDISSVSFQSGKIRLEIADEDMIYRPYATGPEARTYRARRRLPPGGEIASELIALTSSLGRSAGVVPFPFSRPGRHSLRAFLFQDGVGRASQFSVMEIEVAAGDPAASPLRFFPSIEDYASAVGADYSSPLSKESVGRWESFVRKNPGSVFAPFVARELGSVYLQGTGLAGPDPVRAAELFTMAAQTAPTPLQDECLLGLAKAQIAAGNATEARATVDRILKSNPSSDTGEEARRIREGLINGLRTLEDIFGR
jgi:hypothetical protein